jgi:hypothetical protein
VTVLSVAGAATPAPPETRGVDSRAVTRSLLKAAPRVSPLLGAK